MVRVDLMEDAASSMSPEVDIGQIQGGFIMGLGYWTHENMIYDANGFPLTFNTWHYKVPGVKDIPINFNVKLKQQTNQPTAVFNSKGKLG